MENLEAEGTCVAEQSFAVAILERPWGSVES
jgi:hypothetical protein